MNRSAWAEISGDAIAYNLGFVRRTIKDGTRVCAVLKGNAYGHGMLGVKAILAERGLADMTAVGHMSELRCLLKETDDGQDILLLGMAEAEEAEELILQMKEKSACALFSLYSMRQFHSLNALGKRTGRKIRVHIRTDIHDSGMGLGYEEFLKHEEELFFSEGVEISGLYGHLYSAYSDSREEKEKELQAFDELIHRIPEEHRNKILIHVLNSSLSLQFPEYSFDMVRIGSYMYGLTGRNGGYLKPAMRICARIFDVRELDLPVPLSYQPAVLKEGKRRIARAMIGYHDAPILLTQKNLQVLIRGQLFPLADDICMDNISIDVTGCKDVAVGDTVVMLGEAGVRDDKVVERTGLEYVHTDRLTITAERLEKIYR